MLALPRLAILDFVLVAGLPFAPPACGQEHADEQAEDEDESRDRPDVRVGGEIVGHARALSLRKSRLLRFNAPPRSHLPPARLAGPARSSRAGAHHWPWRKLSLIEQDAGPRMTTKSVGRMNRISG